MYEYITGKIEELSPTYVVIDCNGIGYILNISLTTYSKIQDTKEPRIKLYVHQIIKDDAHSFFGFKETRERELFRQLITVSGIGANTARMILSSMSPDEVVLAISTDNVNAIKSVKGIGIKTAQKVIIELKDKINKDTNIKVELKTDNPYKEEAEAALIMLGFTKNDVKKVITKILSKEDVNSVGELVKLSLKQL
ncbi:MAG: Holliday junction branch migration protein RuvA [Marinifilaceae bacterium]|nr:Holliday junction branch migration protein RuvA [Marinilabiliaceae bacterium JC040]MCT4600748.1 Holliday junction branch migration protein RuvA [Marinifilaceae bacterium]